MKKILLLGDSIRMSYQPIVKEQLAGTAEVVGPADNCRFALYTWCRMATWLTELGKPDIVHWNNGLWDAGHCAVRRPVQIPIDDYIGNLRFILGQLRPTGATIIWASSTPAHPDRPQNPNAWSWRNDEIVQYNAAAAELMAAEKIAINDLHRLIWAKRDESFSQDMLHLAPSGQQACAAAVCEMVKQYL